jgi:hypothetical protein
MRYLFLFFFPALAPAQILIGLNVYSEYQKSIPAYKKSSETVFLQVGDSLKQIRSSTDTWSKNEHVVFRQELLSGNCVWEAHTYYSSTDTGRIELRSFGCGKPAEALTEIHVRDTITLINDQLQIKAITVFDPANRSRTRIIPEDDRTLKTVTTEEKGKKREDEFVNGQLQLSRIYYGKENRYDSVLQFNETNVLFMKTIYAFNTRGDVDWEQDYRMDGEVRAAYRTSYTYRYDDKGNWTEKRVRRNSFRSGADASSSSPDSPETIWVYKRVLVY